MEELRLIKKEKGQTLIEALVALAAAVAVVYAISTAVISALSNAQFSKNQVLATQYAQQGIEIVRQIRDSDWTTFSTYLADVTNYYCLDKNSKSLRPQGLGCGLNADNFIREVQIQKNSSDCRPPSPFRTTNAARVTVIVKWSDGKCAAGDAYCHKVQLASCLSDFQVISTP